MKLTSEELQNRLWRTGGPLDKGTKAIYAMVDKEGTVTDPLVGVMETNELALTVVRQHNDVLHPDHEWVDLYDEESVQGVVVVCIICGSHR